MSIGRRQHPVVSSYQNACTTSAFLRCVTKTNMIIILQHQRFNISASQYSLQRPQFLDTAARLADLDDTIRCRQRQAWSPVTWLHTAEKWSSSAALLRHAVLCSKMHSRWNTMHRLPFSHRDEISGSIHGIQMIFTIRILLVTVPSAEIRPALGKHTWVTVPSLSVIWILSAVQLYLQLVAIRLGWFLVNSTWQTD